MHLESRRDRYVFNDPHGRPLDVDRTSEVHP
jgi:hypothetical protein